MPNKPFIEFKDVTKSYGENVIIDKMNFSIATGETVTFIGPSGVGKSTILRMINMLTPPTSGSIIVDGVDVTKEKAKLPQVRAKMQMVFQSFNLFSNKNVIENLILGPTQLLKMDKDTTIAEAFELLGKVGLRNKGNHYPNELSGGQKQRVAIARALAMHPKAILFDEPTSALDPTMIGEVLNVIRDLTSDHSLTTLLVTHEMKFAREVSSRIMFVDDKGIYEDGTPDEIFFHPKKEKTQAFIFESQLFHYSINGKDYDLFDFDNKLTMHLKGFYVPEKLINKCTVFFEEVCFLSLPKRYAKTSITLYVSKEDGSISGKISYEGDEYNPMLDKEKDEISLSLIKAFASTEHSYSNGVNTIAYKIK